MSFYLNILSQLTKLSLIKRRFLIILFDSFLLEISFLLSYWLTKSFIPNIFSKRHIFMTNFVILSGIFLYTFSGQYKGITKYIDSKLFYKICLYNFILSILIKFVDNFFFDSIFNFKQLIAFWIILTTSFSTSRIIIRDFLLKINNRNKVNRKVAIYGAGSAGAQLAKSLNISGKYDLKVFIDDSSQLWGRQLYGAKILSSDKLFSLKNKLSMF